MWKSPFPENDPRHYLLEYQLEVRNGVLGNPNVPGDKGNDFVLWAASRRIGKDHTMAEVAVEDCFHHSVVLDKPTKWTFAAPSERQSRMTVEMCKTHTQAWGMVVDDITEAKDEKSGVLINSTEITIASHKGKRGPVSKIICIPGKPETTRGLDSNVALTECEFFERPKETMRALAPSVLNQMSGVKKKFVAYSSVAGLDGILRMYGGEAWDTLDHEGEAKSDRSKLVWKLFKTTIERAVSMGLKVDVDECRGLFAGDDDGYAAEFMCQFLDSAAILFPYEILLPCENPLATLKADPEFWNARSTPVYGGLDFARMRHFSVLWTCEDVGGFLMTKDVDAVQRMSTPDQFALFAPKIERMARCSVDYTGPGVGLGDLLVEKFGEWNPTKGKFGKIELCTFSAAFKAANYPALKVRFENKTIGTPKSFEVREDLHSIYRLVSGGSITYGAPTLAGGHADRATALMLCNRAAGQGAGRQFEFKPAAAKGGRGQSARRARQDRRQADA